MTHDEPIETEPRTVYRVVLAVVHHDDLTEDELRDIIENTKYPNRCMYPSVVSVESREVDYHDNHPLNLTAQWEREFRRIFPPNHGEIR